MTRSPSWRTDLPWPLAVIDFEASSLDQDGYPNARILVADETNFSKDKRQRFLARAATATWDCIIITHSAFKFIPAPAKFERRLIQDALASYATLLEKVDGDDRLTRKRIERMKEGLEAKLEALGARKDDLLTISEIGVDQLIVDEAQEFRKLSFATKMNGLKGVAPDGSQRAWEGLPEDWGLGRPGSIFAFNL